MYVHVCVPVYLHVCVHYVCMCMHIFVCLEHVCIYMCCGKIILRSVTFVCAIEYLF